MVADGPCDWDIDTSCVPFWDELTPAAQEVGYHLSTLTLWALTGRRFGQCEITVQPCMERRRWPLYEVFPVPGYGGGGAGIGAAYPYILDGSWYNRGCGGGCQCRARCEVALDGPTTTAGVLEVLVHGEVVDPSAYQIQNGYLLVRIDGQCWPGCVDYSKQDPAAFVVRYLRGEELVAGLQMAAGILAGEYALSCDGDDRCRLPARLTSLTRQGVSVQVATINSYMDLGLTEIPEVDRIVVVLNPYQQMSRAQVFSVDRPRPRMVT